MPVGKNMQRRYVRCPGCELSYEHNVPLTKSRVVRFGCVGCGGSQVIKDGGTGEAVVTTAKANEADERKRLSDFGPRRFPIIWSPSEVVRVLRPNSFYVNQPRIDTSSEPYRRFEGYSDIDRYRLPLVLAGQSVDAQAWSDAVCRCVTCDRLLEEVTWPRPGRAGEGALVGIVVVDVRLKSYGPQLDRLGDFLRQQQSAAVVLLCRRCHAGSVFLLRGNGLAGRARSLDTALTGMEQLF